MKKLLPLLTLLLLLFMQCSSFLFDWEEDKPSHSLAQITMPFYDSKITLYVAIPQSYANDPSQAPLVLGLHWGGQTGYTAAIDYLESFMIPAFKESNAILICPVCPVYSTLESGWLTPIARYGVEAIVDSAQHWYKINPEQIAITGFSMGGTGGWYHATKNDSPFDAAVLLACAPPATVENPSHCCPIYAVHGTLDEEFPIEEIRSTVSALQKQGLAVTLQEVPKATHYNIELYEPALADAVEWLEQLWAPAQ